MKAIEKGEMYRHVSEFLKAKGIELKAGSYTQTIEKSCGLLTDTINLGQRGLVRAKEEVGEKLDKVRQVIHEKTAPKAPPSATAEPPPTANPEPPPAAKMAPETIPSPAPARARRKPKVKAKRTRKGK